MPPFGLSDHEVSGIRARSLRTTHKIALKQFRRAAHGEPGPSTGTVAQNPAARVHIGASRAQQRLTAATGQEERMAIDEKVAAQVSPREVIARAVERGVKIVDLRFTDLPGTWQHFSIPISELTESLFVEGIGFDGSSIRGFQQIHESDMLLFLDPDTAIVDPCLEVPTLSVICDIKDPLRRQPYSRDPRYVAKKAEAFLRDSGVADISYWGPEAEFYIFNSVRFDQNAHEGYYFVDSIEGIWNIGHN